MYAEVLWLDRRQIAGRSSMNQFLAFGALIILSIMLSG